jgi:hypothetical protein
MDIGLPTSRLCLSAASMTDCNAVGGEEENVQRSTLNVELRN